MGFEIGTDANFAGLVEFSQPHIFLNFLAEMEKKNKKEKQPENSIQLSCSDIVIEKESLLELNTLLVSSGCCTKMS